MNRAIVSALLFLLSACTNGVSSDFKHTTKNIAVLSFAGHQLHSLENVEPDRQVLDAAIRKLKAAQGKWEYGLIAEEFNISPKRRWEHEIPDWGLDDFLRATATSALTPTYNVVPFAYNSAAYTDKSAFGIMSDDEAAELADLIRAQPGYAAAGGVDAYLVLIPNQRHLTVHSEPSIGMGMTKSFFVKSFEVGAPIESYYMLHALYFVALFDGKNLELLSSEPVIHDKLYQQRFRGYPGKYIDATYWAENFDALTPDQREKITVDLEEMIAATLPDALRQINLIP